MSLPRVLSSALVTELGLTITRPGYLVSVAFATPQYFSTLGTISWNGQSWIGSDIKVSPLDKELSANRVAQFSIGNTDGTIGATVLADGFGDRAVNIYTVYAGATALGDVVQEFSGVGDAVEIDKRVTFGCVIASSAKNFAPRRRLNVAAGLTMMIPAGTHITVGGETIILERG